MRASKRKYVIEALRSIPVGEFTPYDIQRNCRREITVSEVSGNLRSIEGVRYIRRGSRGGCPSVWEKMY